MTVLRRYLRDNRRSLTGWALGMLGLVAFTVAFYPSVKGQASFEKVMEDLPDPVKAIIGAREGVPITSPPGYLHGRLFSVVAPVLLLTFGIGLGARAIGGSEDDGTLELLLGNPVSRRRVLVERFASVVLVLTAVGAALCGSLLLLAPFVGLLDGVSAPRVVGACLAATCLALLHGTVAFTVGAATGRSAPAVAVATSLATAGYLVEGVAAITGGLDALRAASPWHWYLDRNVLVEGLAAPAVGLPIVFSAVLLGAAAWAFTRRDLR